MKKKFKISDHIRSRTKEWLRKADHELAYLKYSPFDIDDPPTDTACKMAHWVVEYSLKAVLIFNKMKVKVHGHDLISSLTELIKIDSKFETLKDSCFQVSNYKVDFTYPLDAPEVISVDEAKAAILYAEEINDFVKEWLSESGL